jgi:hypothetical protein
MLKMKFCGLVKPRKYPASGKTMRGIRAAA